MRLSNRFPLIISAMIFLTAVAPFPTLAEEIKVGVILPLSGKLARFGEIERDSFLMAVEEINGAGGIHERMIDLIVEDTASRPETGRSAIKKLISEDKVVVVGGGCSSPVTYEAAALAQEEEIPFLVNTASADKITEMGWEYVFRLNPPVSRYPVALTSFLKDVARVRTAAILYEDSHFGRYGLKKFLRMCKKSSFKVVMRRAYETDRVDFKPLLIRLVKKRPDTVYLVAHGTETAMIMQQAMELNFNPRLTVWRAPGLTIPESYGYAGPASEYLFSPALWSPNLPYPGAKDFYDKFFERFNTAPDYHGAEAYAAMHVIADALKRAKPLTPKDVRETLADTNMMTVFGPVRFISYGKKARQNLPLTLLLQRIGGGLEVVWPKKVATERYVCPVPKWSER